MKRIIEKLDYVFIFATMGFCAYSCGGSCNCQRDLGCKIITVELKSNGKAIETKRYCSSTNFYTDESLQDSVNAFASHKNSDSTTLNYRDSLYYYETVKKVKPSKTKEYTSKGFGCICSK